ncbi:MAG: hypothetical protein L0338_27280 [Acidobacteria bacterium]|nr:hypothetical protein [Acidobacteriota bacterium]
MKRRTFLQLSSAALLGLGNHNGAPPYRVVSAYKPARKPSVPEGKDRNNPNVSGYVREPGHIDFASTLGLSESDLLNIANYSDKSRMCLFAAAAGWIRLPRPNAGEGLGVRGNPREWISARNPALDAGLEPCGINEPCARPLTPSPPLAPSPALGRREPKSIEFLERQ